LNAMSKLGNFLRKLAQEIQPVRRGYGYFQSTALDAEAEQFESQVHGEQGNCPTCGEPLTSYSSRDQSWAHNTETCRLVNLALSEMGVSFDSPIRIEIYQNAGPLKGYYATVQPLTIHISEDAYRLFPEYMVFHETRHLVDCLTKGWSDENSPDPFARQLCMKYGFRCPPPLPPYSRPDLFSSISSSLFGDWERAIHREAEQ
jgi:hypothetical protein